MIVVTSCTALRAGFLRAKTGRCLAPSFPPMQAVKVALQSYWKYCVLKIDSMNIFCGSPPDLAFVKVEALWPKQVLSRGGGPRTRIQVDINPTIDPQFCLAQLVTSRRSLPPCPPPPFPRILVSTLTEKQLWGQAERLCH